MEPLHRTRSLRAIGRVVTLLREYFDLPRASLEPSLRLSSMGNAIFPFFWISSCMKYGEDEDSFWLDHVINAEGEFWDGSPSYLPIDFWIHLRLLR